MLNETCSLVRFCCLTADGALGSCTDFVNWAKSSGCMSPNQALLLPAIESEFRLVWFLLLPPFPSLLCLYFLAHGARVLGFSQPALGGGQTQVGAVWIHPTKGAVLVWTEVLEPIPSPSTSSPLSVMVWIIICPSRNAANPGVNISSFEAKI